MRHFLLEAIDKIVFQRWDIEILPCTPVQHGFARVDDDVPNAPAGVPRPALEPKKNQIITVKGTIKKHGNSMIHMSHTHTWP